MSTYSPIILFCYKRPESTIKTINALKHNVLARESILYVFSDGPKNKEDEPPVMEIRKYLQTVTGFENVIIVESPVNKGLANSVISGVSQVVDAYGRVIVLEDDLLLSPNFLTFMNAALVEYKDNPMIYSISGFIFDIPQKQDYAYDVFFTKRHCSWGWAIWKDRWNKIDWEIKDFDAFIHSPSQRKALNHIGSDLTRTLNKQMSGRVDSWAIRCIYNQFKKQTYTVYPLKSKVVNTGFGNDATHTNIRFNKYKATLDKGLKSEFNFPENPFEDENLLKAFNRKYSRTTRLYYYGLNKIFK